MKEQDRLPPGQSARSNFPSHWPCAQDRSGDLGFSRFSVWWRTNAAGRGKNLTSCREHRSYSTSTTASPVGRSSPFGKAWLYRPWSKGVHPAATGSQIRRPALRIQLPPHAHRIRSAGWLHPGDALRRPALSPTTAAAARRGWRHSGGAATTILLERRQMAAWVGVSRRRQAGILGRNGYHSQADVWREAPQLVRVSAGQCPGRLKLSRIEAMV